MTIQFNLLPDIKIQYLKAKRQKHLFLLASISASIVGLTVFVMLLVTVFVLQKKNLNDLNKDIKASSSQLQSVEDLNKILTVQSQLTALPKLHDAKVVSSRLTDYLTQVTPSVASISKLNVDYALNTLTIAGATSDLAGVNLYTDTLKFTKFTTKNITTEKNAFSDVVLNSFTREADRATYEITLKFDPLIFSNAEEVKLNVPKITTTRSEVDRPAQLFQQPGGAQ